MTALMIGGSVLSAYGQVRQGQAQKAMYQAQAQQAQIQGRSQAIKARQEALAYRQEGVKSLENTRRNMATMNARGAAGALDPFSGSVGNLMTLNMGYGVEDYYTALDNVALAQENQNIAFSLFRSNVSRNTRPFGFCNYMMTVRNWFRFIRLIHNNNFKVLEILIF